MVQDNVVKKQVSVVKIVLLAGVFPIVLISVACIGFLFLSVNFFKKHLPWEYEIGKWISQTPHMEFEATTLRQEDIYGYLIDKNGDLITVEMQTRIQQGLVGVFSYDADNKERISLFDARIDIVDNGFVLTIKQNQDYIFNNEYPSITFYKV
ncbi:MAG: hypothetical protein FWF56_05125 [Firmicutes bacterium]|nr:hypothetical protein [Bacillota bacterium]MCL1953353.1 hypothetical protein [Bacillota bacterium]